MGKELLLGTYLEVELNKPNFTSAEATTYETRAARVLRDCIIQAFMRTKLHRKRYLGNVSNKPTATKVKATSSRTASVTLSVLQSQRTSAIRGCEKYVSVEAWRDDAVWKASSTSSTS